MFESVWTNESTLNIQVEFNSSSAGCLEVQFFWLHLWMTSEAPPRLLTAPGPARSGSAPAAPPLPRLHLHPPAASIMSGSQPGTKRVCPRRRRPPSCRVG
ncbi:hypothetical protein OJAV_G00223020 [Oryzias javanicus]|uniref:Uncharacterized protein n=1 Tax=Oryzias javanicus TaxID=123683 RepID=A0A3S2NQ62_ORYJA|nr:hypothetical protein OJAV_G00223020 [Oryzias javanicus]